MAQIHGKAGQVCSVRSGKRIGYSVRSAEIIVDPFEVDVNDKKFIDKVYSAS